MITIFDKHDRKLYENSTFKISFATILDTEFSTIKNSIDEYSKQSGNKIVFYNVRFERLSDALLDIDFTKFSQCCFNGCYFNFNETVDCIILKNCTFNNCSFSGNVFSTKLYDCNFFNCYVSNNNINAVKWSNCDFDGTIFKNNEYSNELKIDACKNLHIPKTCPEGDVIGYKKVKKLIRKEIMPYSFVEHFPYIVKLLIPKEAERVGINSKCRCEFAKVLEIQDLDGHKVDVSSVLHNGFYKPLEYKVGEIVYPDEWDSNEYDTCSHGIHFFINRQQAVDY